LQTEFIQFKHKFIMTKKFLHLIFAITVAGGVYAQECLEARFNSFRPGDKIIKQQMTYASPGAGDMITPQYAA
jgi:hypothetical protein